MAVVVAVVVAVATVVVAIYCHLRIDNILLYSAAWRVIRMFVYWLFQPKTHIYFYAYRMKIAVNVGRQHEKKRASEREVMIESV